jgi:four helix bundle protein
LIRLTARLGEQFAGRADLRNQLERAAESVALNFHEGFGRRTAKDRRHFFDIARGSAYEVAAVADVAVARGMASDEEIAQLLDVTDHLGAMLYRFK